MTATQLDVLVVGGGPTGLTLACQLARFGVRFRIIDKQPDRTRESRALGVQARSLEVLHALGLGEALAARGRTTTRLSSLDSRRWTRFTALFAGGKVRLRPRGVAVTQGELRADHVARCGVPQAGCSCCPSG